MQPELDGLTDEERNALFSTGAKLPVQTEMDFEHLNQPEDHALYFDRGMQDMDSLIAWRNEYFHRMALEMDRQILKQFRDITDPRNKTDGHI